MIKIYVHWRVKTELCFFYLILDKKEVIVRLPIGGYVTIISILRHTISLQCVMYSERNITLDYNILNAFVLIIIKFSVYFLQ